MSSAETQLNLVVPFFTDTRNSIEPLLAEVGKQQFPVLQNLLSRADRIPGPFDSVDALICDLFGVRADKGIPYAAISWLADTGTAASDDILRVDPVHLHPDMEHVLLFDSRHFDLDADEVTSLLETLNEFLADEGYRIDAPTPARWYLHGIDNSGTAYTPINVVSGENILPHFPTGDLADKWRQLLNEIQMLLHVHSVNQNREQSGQYTVNSIWPWGSGKIEQTGRPEFSACSGESILVKGLSQLSGTLYTPQLGVLSAHTSHLACLPVLGDYSVESLSRYLSNLENDWMVPLQAKVMAGELDSFKIYFGTGTGYVLTKKQTRHWWRRNKPLAELLS